MSENEKTLVLDVPVRDIDRVLVNMEMLSNQDLEDLESGSFRLINAVFDHLVTIPGHDHRKLHYSTMVTITKAVKEAVEAEQNPVIAGKN